MEARGIGIFHVNLFALECPKSVNIDYWVHLFFLFFVLLVGGVGRPSNKKRKWEKLWSCSGCFCLDSMTDRISEMETF